MKNRMEEGTLHKWFKGSKSKDGKGGWVNVVTGGTCASDEPGEGTPKCVSSAKRASMSKAERLSAARRKKAADPGQQQKTGAAKPTYVSTDKKKMKKEEVKVMGENVSSGKSRIAKSGRVGGKVVGTVSNSEKVKERQQEKAKEKTKEKSAGEAAYKESSAKGLSPAEALYRKKQAERNVARERIKSKEKKEKERLKGGRFGRIREEVEVTEAKDKKGKGSGKKDACYKKVKASAKVWPSAYASGRLVQCRKKGAANYGNKSEGITFQQFQEKAKKCWDTHKKVGMKMKGGKLVNDCRPKNEELTNEGASWTKKAGKNPEGGLNEKGRKSYERENPGSDLKAPSKKVGNKRRASFCARMKGMKAKLTSTKTARDPDSRINKSLRAWNC